MIIYCKETVSKKLYFFSICFSILFVFIYRLAFAEETAVPAQFPPSNTEIAKLIGWVNDPQSDSLCKGYYVEPNLNPSGQVISSSNDIKKTPVHINANYSTFGQHENAVLAGNVQITQPDRFLSADKVILVRDPVTQKIIKADATGHLLLREPGSVLFAEKGNLHLSDHSGELSELIYRMTNPTENKTQTISQTNDSASTHFLPGDSVWGTALRALRLPSGVLEVYDGTYSACPPEKAGWHIKAKRLTLNRDTGRGEAADAILYVDKLPILYVPYFNFPLDNRRKSGFLYPTVESSTQTGLSVATPYYFNLAPNYDLTFTPDLMGIRGVQLDGLFRYLTNNSRGKVHATFLPADREFSSFQNETDSEILGTTELPSDLQTAELKRLRGASDNRYLFSLEDTRKYDPNWSSYLYLNRVSDDYYFENFSGIPGQITQNQLLNEGDIYYNNAHWHFTGQMQGYQTLHPANQSPVNNQYQKLPELLLAGNYPFADNAAQFNLRTQYDDFVIHDNPGETISDPEGQRFFLFPDINKMYNTAWGYFKPDFQLALREYALQNQPTGEANQITSVLPIVDLDGGLFFDKKTTLFSHQYTQTFEPRIFYLYVPYQNQNDIPLFDTTVTPFSFAQLFQTNRYAGYDRIGDTNQVSLAATTRFIDALTGDEKASLSLGQILYFEKRRVNLPNDTLDFVAQDNQVPPDNLVSPIAAALNYEVIQHWNALANLAYDPVQGAMNNTNLLLQYKRDNAHIVNIGYNFLRGGDAFVPSNGEMIPESSSKNNLNQTDFSLVWPLAKAWRFVGRWNYNISHNYPQTYFAGLQYDSCCWSARLIAGREFNYLDNNNAPIFDNRVYFQIALKTLGNVTANNPDSLLTAIPGYADDFGK